MKYLLIFILTTFVSVCPAQVTKPEKTFKVPLKTEDEKLLIEVDNTSKKISTKSDRVYYWFKSKEVHSTEGAYSGKLLHGEYIVHYKSNQLKTKGSFKYGLKDGEWTTWDETGKKIETITWNKGVQKAENHNETKVKHSESIQEKEDVKGDDSKNDLKEKKEPKKKKVKKQKKENKIKEKEVESDKANSES